MVQKIRGALGDVTGKKISILGLTFKPETDDMRDSPALSIIPALLDKGASIHAHDPQGMDEAKKLLGDSIVYEANVNDLVVDADALVLLTEWNEYRSLNLEDIRENMQGNAFIDLRNVYEREQMEARGFEYFAVGR